MATVPRHARAPAWKRYVVPALVVAALAFALLASLALAGYEAGTVHHPVSHSLVQEHGQRASQPPAAHAPTSSPRHAQAAPSSALIHLDHLRHVAHLGHVHHLHVLHLRHLAHEGAQLE